jgi:hypothetical protein
MGGPGTSAGSLGAGIPKFIGKVAADHQQASGDGPPVFSSDSSFQRVRGCRDRDLGIGRQGEQAFSGGASKRKRCRGGGVQMGEVVLPDWWAIAETGKDFIRVQFSWEGPIGTRPGAIGIGPSDPWRDFIRTVGNHRPIQRSG